MKSGLWTGLLLLQTTGLVAAVGWMVANPVLPLPEKRGGASVLRPHRASGAEFHSEKEALVAWVGQIDRGFDLETVLGGGVDLDALKRTREAALACPSLGCPDLEMYASFARGAGRPVPPKPMWDPTAKDRRAVALYVDDLQAKLTGALAEEGAPELLPSEERAAAARGCEGFECSELNAYLAVAKHAFKVLGQELPPPPEPPKGEGR